MLTQYEEKMQKSVENLEAEYATIRAGRANPNILNKIKVEYYGVEIFVPLKLSQA